MSFFAPAPSRSTTLFTRLPDRFRKPKATAWARANRGGQEIDSLLEGPCFDRAGRLYAADLPFGRIFRISPEGDWEQAGEYDGWPNGLETHQDGRIFITCYKHGIMLLDPDDSTVTPFVETAGSDGSKGVNDLKFGFNGDLDSTDQGQTGLQDPTGRVYCLKPADELTCLIDTVPSPNGIVIDTAM